MVADHLKLPALVLLLGALLIPALAESDGRSGFDDLRGLARKSGLVVPTTVRRPTPPPAATVPTPPPVATVPTPPPVPPSHAPVVRHIGETGTDEGVDFTVDSVTIEGTVRRQRYDNPPPLRGRLAVARVTYVNHTSRSLDLFCGGGGARVVDTDGQAYRTVEGLYDI